MVAMRAVDGGSGSVSVAEQWRQKQLDRIAQEEKSKRLTPREVKELKSQLDAAKTDPIARKRFEDKFIELSTNDEVYLDGPAASEAGNQEYRKQLLDKSLDETIKATESEVGRLGDGKSKQSLQMMIDDLKEQYEKALEDGQITDEELQELTESAAILDGATDAQKQISDGRASGALSTKEADDLQEELESELIDISGNGNWFETRDADFGNHEATIDSINEKIAAKMSNDELGTDGELADEAVQSAQDQIDRAEEALSDPKLTDEDKRARIETISADLQKKIDAAKADGKITDEEKKAIDEAAASAKAELDGLVPQATSTAETKLTAEQVAQEVGKCHLLKKGMESDEVKDLQTRLNEERKAAGLPEIEVTGKFDDATLDAVREYQEAKGLEVDGVVGAQTWSSLISNNEQNLAPGKTGLAAGEPPALTVTPPADESDEKASEVYYA